MQKVPPSNIRKRPFSNIYKTLCSPFVEKEMLQAEEEIERYGFDRKSTIKELAAILLFLALFSGAVGIIVWLFNLKPVPWSQAFTAILSLGVAIVAYRQWRAARHEISIDKYYDRLESANKRLEVLQTDQPSAEDMHAFAELDKLEYVIVKYEHGYISPVLALRALKNFQGLCVDRKGFIEKAAHWVEQASYRDVTRRVVRTVCRNCPSSSDSQ